MKDTAAATDAAQRKPTLAGVCRYINAGIIAGFAVYIFLIPGIITVVNLCDPAIGGEGIPRMAWRQHRNLTKVYGPWARERVASGVATNMPLFDIPATEWAIFGSVYYLWSTEALQDAWEEDNSLCSEEPRVYARDTIEAAVDLVLDEHHHTWVRTHWGDNYMHRENVFFRSLIIAALTSHEKLVGDGRHRDLLLDQVNTLAAELDASPYGVLNDYPNECYPIDVLAAIACIRRADKVLGTDHSAFVSRSIRAFQGEQLDERGLIPYFMVAETGKFFKDEPSRGTGNSYILIFAPELWPDQAAEWYPLYEEHFWQELWWAEGFREYPRDVPGKEWTYDVDAGPILAGFSPSANSFGMAASKINGRLDHHEIIGSQITAACWPLADGTWLGPRILSDPDNAPYLGEACLLHSFVRQPAEGVEIVTGGHWATAVYIGLIFYFGAALLFLTATALGLRRWRRTRDRMHVPAERAQVIAWAVILVPAVVLMVCGSLRFGVIAILLAQFLPRRRRIPGQPRKAAAAG